MGVLRIPVLPVPKRPAGANVPAQRTVAPATASQVGRQPDSRLSDEDLERWLVEWIPLERDRLTAEYEAAAESWCQVQGLRDVDPEHRDVLWAEMVIRDACEQLASHDRFAEWATKFLTCRWQNRMRKLVELW